MPIVPSKSVVRAQRHCQVATRSAQIDKRAALTSTGLISFLGHQIVNLDDVHTFHYPPGHCARIGDYWVTHAEVGKSDRYSAQRHRFKLPAFVDVQLSKCRLAQMHRFFEHSVEHWREVARRRVDDLQYLGGRGLLLAGLAQFGGQ